MRRERKSWQGGQKAASFLTGVALEHPRSLAAIINEVEEHDIAPATPVRAESDWTWNDRVNGERNALSLDQLASLNTSH